MAEAVDVGAEFEALAQEAAQAEQLPEPVDQPGQVDQGPETAALLLTLYQPIAAILLPAWQLQPAEVKALADAHAPAIDKWAPDGLMGRWGVEINALLVTLAIVGPRLAMPRAEDGEPEPVADA